MTAPETRSGGLGLRCLRLARMALLWMVEAETV